MLNLILFVIPLLSGLVLGYSLRDRASVNLGKVTTAIILFLVFSLGLNIGVNEKLFSSIPEVGFNALVFVTFVVLFSVFFLKAAKKLGKL